MRASISAVWASARSPAAVAVKHLRGRPFWPFLGPVVLVVLVSVFGHGDPRYRHAADVSLAILAGIGLAGMKGRPWARPSRS